MDTSQYDEKCHFGGLPSLNAYLVPFLYCNRSPSYSVHLFMEYLIDTKTKQKSDRYNNNHVCL